VQVKVQESTLLSGKHGRSSVTLLLGYTNNNDQLKDDAIVRKTACLRQKGVGVAVV